MLFHEMMRESIFHMFDDPYIYAFLWAVIVDVLTGFCKSLVAKKSQKKTSSTKGITGLIKHMVIMLLVCTGYPLMSAMGYQTEGKTVVIFYFVFYIVSIIENIGQMGLPVPDVIKRHLAKLQDDYDNKGDLK